MYLNRNIAEYICSMRVKHRREDNIVPHYHTSFLGGYDYELVYVVSGRANHTVDGKLFPVKAGNYFFVDYGLEHFYDIAEGEIFEIINLIFDYRAVDIIHKKVLSLAELAAYYGVNRDTADTALRSDMLFYDEDGRMLALFLDISRELGDRLPGYHEIVKCKLMEILLSGFRIYFKQEVKAPCSAPIQAVLEYLTGSYMSTARLSSLAAQLNLSVPYLSKKFKDEVGITYLEYLHSRRISEACRILSTSNDSVESVAEYVGYSDSKKFREKFKEIMGISPREYRRNLLK